MKFLITVLSMCFILCPAATAQEKTPPPKKPETSTEHALTGTIDIGYRWVDKVGGDFNTYRSVVNLGSGPKLFE